MPGHGEIECANSPLMLSVVSDFLAFYWLCPAVLDLSGVSLSRLQKLPETPEPCADSPSLSQGRFLWRLRSVWEAMCCSSCSAGCLVSRWDRSPRCPSDCTSLCCCRFVCLVVPRRLSPLIKIPSKMAFGIACDTQLLVTWTLPIPVKFYSGLRI